MASPASCGRLLCFAVALGFAISRLDAQAAAAEVVVETVLGGLSDPSSVAIRPADETATAYEILVYDRGTGRIVSVQSDEPNKSQKVIDGLTASDESAVVFALNARHVIVSGGAALAAAYALPSDDGPLSADESQAAIDGPDELEPAPPRHVAAIVRTRANRRVPDALVLAVIGEGERSRLWKVPIRADTFGEPAPFSTNASVDNRRISALAVSEQGFIVAAENGAADRPGHNRLTFYNPIDGSPVLRLAVDLREIVAVACSPISGNLYAAGSAPDRETPGVFRLDDVRNADERACKAVKIVDVEQPSALAFGPDGALYVAAIEDVDSEREQGTLKRIKGDL